MKVETDRMYAPMLAITDHVFAHGPRGLDYFENPLKGVPLWILLFSQKWLPLFQPILTWLKILSSVPPPPTIGRQWKVLFYERCSWPLYITAAALCTTKIRELQ